MGTPHKGDKLAYSRTNVFVLCSLISFIGNKQLVITYKGHIISESKNKYLLSFKNCNCLVLMSLSH